MAHTSFFKHDQPSRIDRASQRKKDKEARLREAYKLVDKRDRYKCRACGHPCDPNSVDVLERAHRHHLTFRSKGGQDVASNLVTLCPTCHDRLHVKRTLRIEWGQHGSDGPLVIWRLIQDDPRVSWYISREEMAPHVVQKD